MRIGLRICRPKTVVWLRQALLRGNQSRAVLGREVCDLENRCNRKDRLWEASVRKALPRHGFRHPGPP